MERRCLPGQLLWTDQPSTAIDVQMCRQDTRFPNFHARHLLGPEGLTEVAPKAPEGDPIEVNKMERQADPNRSYELASTD